jgi:hypothetical protein
MSAQHYIPAESVKLFDVNLHFIDGAYDRLVTAHTWLEVMTMFKHAVENNRQVVVDLIQKDGTTWRLAWPLGEHNVTNPQYFLARRIGGG